MLKKLQEKYEPQMSTISARFNQLETRDQKALIILSVFLFLMLIYALVWIPVSEMRQNAEKSRDAKRNLVEWLVSKQTEAKAAAGAQAKPPQTSNVPMISLANQSAQKHNVTLKRFEPDGDNKLRVWLEDVPFNRFILWIQDLESQHQVHVNSLSLDNAEQTGRIGAKLVLSR